MYSHNIFVYIRTFKLKTFSSQNHVSLNKCSWLVYVPSTFKSYPDLAEYILLAYMYSFIVYEQLIFINSKLGCNKSFNHQAAEVGYNAFYCRVV